MPKSKGVSPYSTDFASGDIAYDYNANSQMKSWKKEELDTHIAPNFLPYELSSLPQYFGMMVDNGMRASQTIEDYLKVNDPKKYDELMKLKKNTDKIVFFLMKNVDAILEKVTIGAKHSKDIDKEKKQVDELYK
jgi:hypothetical protein